MSSSRSLADESPLLHEAFFVAEAEGDWRPHLDALGESPFEWGFEHAETAWLDEAETGVIQGDNRLRVTPTTGVPWRWICRVEVKGNRERQAGGGTGVLISNRHVLTAAHVVYDAAQNMQNFEIRVIPGLDYGTEPFGAYVVTARPRLPADYDPDAANHLDYDYALLKLNTAVGEKKFGGSALCFWGSPTCGANSVFARPDPATLNGKAVFTAGYPRSSGSNKLMSAAGILHSAQRLRRTMGLTADTTKGQSGSPVWAVENGRSCLVGIAAGAGAGTNRAVRVTRELIRQLRAWIAEDGETPAMIDTEAPLDSPGVELFDRYAATEAEEERGDDEPSFEMLVPSVSTADLRKRIDEYYDLALATYTLPIGTTARARPQFRYARGGGMSAAIKTVSGILGSKFEKDNPKAIYMAAYGRAKPSQIAAITQGLLDAGKLAAVSAANPGLSDAQAVREMQREYKMGIDCAGYVQLAFIYAYLGSDDDPPSVRKSLGLHPRRGWEKLAGLSKKHFDTVKVTDGQTGDLLVLKPQRDSADGAWHTVIVVERTSSGTVHKFLVDASWGVDLYGAEYGGVARRTIVHDSSTDEWWDINPATGREEPRSSDGPYGGHPVHGMFRARVK